MRVAVALAVLLVLATACTSRADSTARTSTTPEVSVPPSEVAYAGNWPDDAQDLIRRRVSNRGTPRIYCGNLYGGKGACYATWTTRNGSRCRTDFSFYAKGNYLLDATDGLLVSCTAFRTKTSSG
jgi:hypothetical protein